LNDVNDAETEKTKMNMNQEQTNSGGKLNTQTYNVPSKSQRLFLIIEAQRLKVSVRKYRDNRIKTVDNNHISLGGLQIMSPGYLNKYMLDD
jgi:hypothetical protein